MRKIKKINFFRAYDKFSQLGVVILQPISEKSAKTSINPQNYYNYANVKHAIYSFWRQP